MRWCRSWPTDDDWARRSQRPHVVDRLPRLLMSNFDYLTVTEWPTGRGIYMLEWDIALEPRSRGRFAKIADEQPDRVLVAPYQYGAFGYLPDVEPGTAEVDAFGFGCIYFPRPVLFAGLEHFRSTRARLCDMTFSTWHAENYGPARVTWEVHPQHLHEF